MNKISTVEEVQAELRAIWAMTEETSPSRAKLAASIQDLAHKVASASVGVLASAQQDDLQQERAKLDKALNREQGILSNLLYALDPSVGIDAKAQLDEAKRALKESEKAFADYTRFKKSLISSVR